MTLTDAIWAAHYVGWVAHWRDRVLVGRSPDGREVSVGEVYVRPRGGLRWEVLHPTSGRVVARGDAPSLVAARSCAAQAVADRGGSFDDPVEPRRGRPPVTRDRVVAAVLAHPEGVAQRQLVAELGLTEGAVHKALSVAAALGLVRRTGWSSTSRYWPPSGASRPEPSVAVQSVAEPSTEGPGASPVAAPTTGATPVAEGLGGHLTQAVTPSSPTALVSEDPRRRISAADGVATGGGVETPAAPSVAQPAPNGAVRVMRGGRMVWEVAEVHPAASGEGLPAPASVGVTTRDGETRERASTGVAPGPHTSAEDPGTARAGVVTGEAERPAPSGWGPAEVQPAGRGDDHEGTAGAGSPAGAEPFDSAPGLELELWRRIEQLHQDVADYQREAADYLAQLADAHDDATLFDRVLDEAGVLPGWPRAVRLGAALDRLLRP